MVTNTAVVRDRTHEEGVHQAGDADATDGVGGEMDAGVLGLSLSPFLAAVPDPADLLAGKDLIEYAQGKSFLLSVETREQPVHLFFGLLSGCHLKHPGIAGGSPVRGQEAQREGRALQVRHHHHRRNACMAGAGVVGAGG
jgi:hypothetical protein